MFVHKGIKLSRVYPYTPPGSGKSKHQFTDYYFWSLEEFSKELSFICEGKQEEIGCVEVISFLFSKILFTADGLI